MPDPALNYSALLRFLRTKPKLQTNPHYPYNMRNVALSLNNESIDTIKLEFGLHNNRIDLQKFIWLLKQATADDAAHSYLLYYELVKLFEEIDIDNSNTIDWAELLQYLSEAAWLTTPSPNDNAHTHDTTVLFHAFHEQAKYRKHPIKKIVQMQRMALIGVLTCYNQLSFINIHRPHSDQGKTQNEGPLNRGFSIHSIDADKVLSLDYSEEERMFGVLLTNRNLCFIEESEIQKSHGVIRSSGTEVDIKYLPLHRLWCLENVGSTLQLFPSPKTALIERKTVFKPHHQPLTGISQISNPLALCTSSLDGLIRLWQHGSSKLIIQLNVGKQMNWGYDHKGVKGIATHNRGIISCIACWMFTSEIYLWLPSLSLSKPFAGELQGHMGLVLQCQFTWCGELVSIDDKRFIRVWNVERFECLQNFTAEEETPSLFVMRSKPYFVFYNKLMHFYRMRTNSKIDLQGDKARSLGSRGLQHVEVVSKLIGLEFSRYYAFLVVATPQQIRIIDVNQTKVVAVITPPSDEQFTHITMRDARRFYASSSRGIIYEHKTEDGELIRQMQVLAAEEEEEPEIKFVHYHEQTQILLIVVESKSCSQIVTYEETGGESRLVKEIEFEQTNLVDFKFCSSTNLFFLLSAENVLSVWDYDKLLILNHIELDKLTEGHFLNIVLDSSTRTLLLQGQQRVTMLGYESNGSIEKIDVLDFRLDLEANRTVIVSASLIRERVPCNITEELKMSQGKEDKQGKHRNRKEVDFAMLDLPPDEILADPETSTEMPILALVNNFSEVYYYRLDQILPQPKRQGKYTLRGINQRMKEKRKTHLKTLPLPQPRTTDCSERLFNEDPTFVPRANRAGNVMGHFYFHTDDHTLFLVNAYGEIKGEWILSLNKPKMWNMAYNEIEQVLVRLQKTEKALQRLYKINSSQFKLQFLTTKYLRAEEIAQLQKEEAKRKLEARSAYIISKRSIDSKKSLTSSQGRIKQPSGSIKTIVPQGQSKNEEENVFENKFNEKGKKKHFQQNQELFKRAQKSIDYCKQISKSVPKIHLQPALPDNPHHFASQIEQLFLTTLNGFHHTPHTELLAISKEFMPRKTSASHLTTPDSKFGKRESPNIHKVRIKSSLSEMSKNFAHTKIELQNFLQRTKGDFGKEIRKKGRTLKLKL